MNAKKNGSLFILSIFLLCCSPKNEIGTLVNPSHLNSLYEEISVDNKTLGIIHIYCEFPDYKWVDDADEGIACVDDVARAAIFYIRDYKQNKNDESLRKAKHLIDFVLHLQSENGYFYNFIFKDYSINKNGKTSVNEPNWWSWRAAWALTESRSIFAEKNPAYADSIQRSLDFLFGAVKKNIPVKYETKNINGFETPTWLLFESASDQTSILMLSLKPYAESKKDSVLIRYADKLAEGMMMMQVKQKNSDADGAFLSWENTWHSWGNIQAYSLLQEGFSENIHNAALDEVKNFYPSLWKQNLWNDYSLQRKGDSISIAYHQFDQIAYGIRPMVFSSMKAYELTGNYFYAEEAISHAMWFFGKNIAKQKMYDPETGRGFDGIRNENSINKNSGAESTIEALLSLQTIEQNETAKKLLREKILQSKNGKSAQ